jgi:hypothetical protein
VSRHEVIKKRITLQKSYLLKGVTSTSQEILENAGKHASMQEKMLAAKKVEKW